MPKAIYIWELPKRARLKYYKAIKTSLVNDEAYTYENLIEVMSGKIVDLPYELI